MGKVKVSNNKKVNRNKNLFKGIYFLCTGKKPTNIYKQIKEFGGQIFFQVDQIPLNFDKKLVLLTYEVMSSSVTFKFLISLALNASILKYSFINYSIQKNKLEFPIKSEFILPRGELTLQYSFLNDLNSNSTVIPQKLLNEETIPNITSLENRVFFRKKFSIINYSERSFFDNWNKVLLFSGARVINNRFEKDIDYFLVQKEATVDQRTLNYAIKNKKIIITSVYIIDSLVYSNIVHLNDKNCIYKPNLNRLIINPIEYRKPMKNFNSKKSIILNKNKKMIDEEFVEEEEVEVEEEEEFIFQWTGEPFEVSNGKKFYFRFEMGSIYKRKYFSVNDVIEIKLMNKESILGVITKCFEEWNGKRRIYYRTLMNRPELSKKENELYLIKFEDSADVTEVGNHIDIYPYICDESHGLFCVKEYDPSNKVISQIEDVIWNIPNRSSNLLFWLDPKPIKVSNDNVKYYNGISVNGNQFFIGQFISMKCVYSGRFCILNGKILEMFEQKDSIRFLRIVALNLNHEKRKWVSTDDRKTIRFDNIQQIKSMLIVEDPRNVVDNKFEDFDEDDEQIEFFTI